MHCHICDSHSVPFARATILHKYNIQYFRCPACGFVQTESPFWLEEAYSTAITRTDIGPVNRMIDTSTKTSAIILSFLNAHGKFVDYGGGYGMFVRRMRDIGFDYYYYDKYCANLFSKGFEANTADTDNFELCTAFEVIEHMVNPFEGIREVMHFSKSIFFSTEVLPAHCPKPGEWWYYGPEHGQHISFLSFKSLYKLASRLGLRLYTYGSFHLMTDKSISPRLFSIVLNPRYTQSIAYLLAKYHKVHSRLQDDWQSVLQASK